METGKCQFDHYIKKKKALPTDASYATEVGRCPNKDIGNLGKLQRQVQPH